MVAGAVPAGLGSALLTKPLADHPQKALPLPRLDAVELGHQEETARQVFSQGLAQELAQKPPLAVASVMRCVVGAEHASLEEALQVSTVAELRSIESAWSEELKFRVHPEWRYCLMNDSDSAVPKQRGMRTLGDAGLELVATGLTDIAEFDRVL